MTKEELISRIKDIEWDDFEAKEAKSELPKNVWESVSAFANTSGGWVVLGVKQNGKKFEVQGVDNIEKLEQDFLGTLRSATKLNMILQAKAQRFIVDGCNLLAFYIPSSPIKPIWFGNSIRNSFVRSGSGDQRATDMEILAMERDQAFGSKSETILEDTSFDDIDKPSLDTYRNAIRQYNPSFVYNGLEDLEFCTKVGILVNGHLTYSSLVMLGKRDKVRRYLMNFWVDYLEIPGTSYQDAEVRYTYRMPELDNLWQCYSVLIQRLRIYADNPFTTGPNGFSPDNEEQLYALREGLVNFLAHFDLFSSMHPTIRVFTNRIEMQNPGTFAIGLPGKNTRITSNPRNPGIIRLFRYPKLAENAGYGIDKMMKWKQLTDYEVTFETDVMSTTVTYWRTKQGLGENHESGVKKWGDSQTMWGEKVFTRRKELVGLLIDNPQIAIPEMAARMSLGTTAIENHLRILRQEGFIEHIGPAKGGQWVVYVNEQIIN